MQRLPNAFERFITNLNNVFFRGLPWIHDCTRTPGHTTARAMDGPASPYGIAWRSRTVDLSAGIASRLDDRAIVKVRNRCKVYDAPYLTGNTEQPLLIAA